MSNFKLAVIAITSFIWALSATPSFAQDVDFTTTITAAKLADAPNSGYQYDVSKTDVTGADRGWWYFIVVEFPNGDKVSKDNKDGVGDGEEDGKLEIDSTNCGQKVNRQREHYKSVSVKLYRTKTADSYKKDELMATKDIPIKPVD